MRTGLAAAMAVLLIPLLAGCAADDGDGAGGGAPLQTTGLPPARLEAGRFYSFRHGGGMLTFTLAGTGDASFDLYDGDDVRLGTVGFTSDPPRSGLHRIEGVGAGDVVLRLSTLNGTLRVQSGGQAVDEFRPLATHVERAVIASNPGQAQPAGPISFPDVLPGGGPADETTPLRLQRTPAELRVLATGPATNLSVEVRSDRGLVLALAGAVVQGSVLSLTPTGVLEPVPAEATLQNVRDGALTAHVTADELAGPVLLESVSYSRAQLPGPAEPGPDPAAVPFSYGVLPDGPQAFAVHAAAERLVLWQEGVAGDGPDAAVVLFGPHDERIGVVLVPPKGSVQVGTLGAGDYVAVPLAGRAALGADRAPADFQLRPLDVEQAVAPAARAGANDAYALAEEPVDAPRAFAVQPALLAGDPGTAFPVDGCDAGRLLVLQQDGETILAAIEPTNANAGTDEAPFLDATLALGDGPYRLLHDGFGDDGCDRPAVALVAYVRP